MADEVRKDKSPVSPSSSAQRMAKDTKREAAAKSDEKKEEKKRLGMTLKAMWKKTGLEPGLLLIMAKYASLRLVHKA
jgi:hypothetical protein